MTSIIKPSDFLIGYAIPNSKSSFYKNYYSGVDIDFTIQNIWAAYNADTVVPAKPLLKYIKKLGVTIKYEYTFGDFSDFFKSGKYKVLVLFSHWKNNHVEFYDGLREISLVSEKIPYESAVILDLNVCKCDALRKLLETSRKNLTIKSNNDRYCYPVFWIRYYKYFFQYISNYNVNFNEANLQCISNFFINLEE